MDGALHSLKSLAQARHYDVMLITDECESYGQPDCLPKTNTLPELVLTLLLKVNTKLHHAVKAMHKDVPCVQ